MGFNMRITDLLDKRSISLNAAPADKKETLDLAVELMAKSGKLSDVEKYRAQVYAREEESTTGIGEGIAIPHGKCDAVKAPGLAAMVIKNGVEYESLDGEPVTLLFLIAAPNTKDNVHLDVLSKLSVMLMDENFTTSLRNAKSVDEFLQIIDAADESAKSIDDRLSDTGITTEEKKGFKLLAVTSCPTGIAHTYMAAEALEKAAKAAGCQIKIETRGSAGAKNVLTAEEIAAADCIIVAADAKVPMDRFDGKKVISCQVSDGIGKAERLVEQAVNGNVEVFHGENGEAKAAVTGKESAAHKIYTQLMNGVSHMLPFVVGGGILIAIAFLIDGLNVDINALPADQRSNFGTITPIAAMFKNIGGVAFGLMLPVLAGYLILGLRKICDKLPDAIEKLAPVLIYPVVGILIMGLAMNFVVEPIMGGINTGLNNFLSGMGDSSRIVLGLILGGMMAIDMGGPFNKAAYVFGTAAITAGNYDIMAAVMIGGMTPPCAIALATLLFKNKFTKEERDAGPTNFIMGLAFITEGAIPFAASDPLHVLPSCIIGSALAGALSMAFHCTLMAPHGGIFVFPVVGNAVMYLVALVAGTVVSALLLGVLKKKVTT